MRRRPPRPGTAQFGNRACRPEDERVATLRQRHPACRTIRRQACAQQAANPRGLLPYQPHAGQWPHRLRRPHQHPRLAHSRHPAQRPPRPAFRTPFLHRHLAGCQCLHHPARHDIHQHRTRRPTRQRSPAGIRHRPRNHPLLQGSRHGDTGRQQQTGEEEPRQRPRCRSRPGRHTAPPPRPQPRDGIRGRLARHHPLLRCQPLLERSHRECVRHPAIRRPAFRRSALRHHLLQHSLLPTQRLLARPYRPRYRNRRLRRL